MPDISMCSGTIKLPNDSVAICPLRETCHRFKAKPSGEYQSYIAEAPYNFETQLCELLWEVETSKDVT